VGPFSNLEQIFAIDETMPNPFHYMDQAILAAAKEKRVGVFLSGFGGDFFVSDKGNEVIYELIKQFKIGLAGQLFLQLKQTEKKSYYTLFKSEFARHTKIGKSILSWKHRHEINWQRDSMLNEDFYIQYRQNVDFDFISHPVKFMLDYIESGRMGRVMGMWANRSSAYAMESAVPLFDKQINEFMFDVPIEQYLVGGHRRSLIRRAMEGILPPEIQWRKDKQPYTPDFHSRIIKEKSIIDTILNDPSFNFAWKYLDKSKIEQHLEGVKPVQNTGEWMTNGGNRVVQGIIAACFLKWLKK
jgi:asparagine synthase (glutamine-hydrolysing)